MREWDTLLYICNAVEILNCYTILYEQQTFCQNNIKIFSTSYLGYRLWDKGWIRLGHKPLRWESGNTCWSISVERYRQRKLVCSSAWSALCRTRHCQCKQWGQMGKLIREMNDLTLNRKTIMPNGLHSHSLLLPPLLCSFSDM